MYNEEFLALQEENEVYKMNMGELATLRSRILKIKAGGPLDQKILVPFGKHAFFPGQLMLTRISSNKEVKSVKITAYLGGDCFVKTKLDESLAIIDRRISMYGLQREAIYDELKWYQHKFNNPGTNEADKEMGEDNVVAHKTIATESADKLVEIKEEIEEVSLGNSQGVLPKPTQTLNKHKTKRIAHEPVITSVANNNKPNITVNNGTITDDELVKLFAASKLKESSGHLDGHESDNDDQMIDAADEFKLNDDSNDESIDDDNGSDVEIPDMQQRIRVKELFRNYGKLQAPKLLDHVIDKKDTYKVIEKYGDVAEDSMSYSSDDHLSSDTDMETDEEIDWDAVMRRELMRYRNNERSLNVLGEMDTTIALNAFLNNASSASKNNAHQDAFKKKEVSFDLSQNQTRLFNPVSDSSSMPQNSNYSPPPTIAERNQALLSVFDNLNNSHLQADSQPHPESARHFKPNTKVERISRFKQQHQKNQ